MGFLNSKNSWSAQAKTESNKTGLLGSKTWSAQAKKANKAKKTCPPVTDCKVKQSLMASAAEQKLWGVKTKKEVTQAKQLANKIASQQKAGRKQARWPYAGTYDPTKGRGRR